MDTSELLRALALAPLVAAGSLLALAQDDAAPAPLLERIGGDATVSAEIGAEELEGHVRALASDLLLGRPMGSPESMVAAEYCAQRLAAAGLVGGAEDGGWLQRIPMGRTVYDAPPELRITLDDGSERTLVNGVEFTFRAAGTPADFGAKRCALVATEEDLPAAVDPELVLIFGTSAGRARGWLRDAGLGDGSGFAAMVIPNARAKAGEPITPRTGRVTPSSGDSARLDIAVVGETAELFASGEVQALAFTAHARAEARDDANVVGVLPGKRAGTDAEEFVVLSAHRDHIGVVNLVEGQPEPEDAIRNGADDDASGCAMVMEIAEAIAAGERPERTLVVLLVTGEEVGMVGSGYWAEHPTVPLERVVCALNFEMLGRPDPLVGGPGKVWLTGDERSSLGPKLREAGLTIQADPRPSFNFFVRSDNVSFARKGIVAQTLSSYGEHTDYHKVSDEWDTLDYAHMEQAAEACLAAVRSLAQGDWAPAWNEGEPEL